MHKTAFLNLQAPKKIYRNNHNFLYTPEISSRKLRGNITHQFYKNGKQINYSRKQSIENKRILAFFKVDKKKRIKPNIHDDFSIPKVQQASIFSGLFEAFTQDVMDDIFENPIRIENERNRDDKSTISIYKKNLKEKSMLYNWEKSLSDTPEGISYMNNRNKRFDITSTVKNAIGIGIKGRQKKMSIETPNILKTETCFNFNKIKKSSYDKAHKTYNSIATSPNSRMLMVKPDMKGTVSSSCLLKSIGSSKKNSISYLEDHINSSLNPEEEDQLSSYSVCSLNISNMKLPEEFTPFKDELPHSLRASIEKTQKRKWMVIKKEKCKFMEQFS